MSTKIVKKGETKMMTDGNECDTKLIYSEEDIAFLLTLLSRKRCDDYHGWIEVGMSLYNINKLFCLMWKKWSQQSTKFVKNPQDINSCEMKWKTFSKNRTTGLKIGSLLRWCKEDNPEKYSLFMRDAKTNRLMSAKFPNDNLLLGETRVVSKNISFTNLNNENCLIYGQNHGSPTMYIENIKDVMMIKCKHVKCFGKNYPCEHIQLTKNEMNIVFNGDIHVNINGDSNLTNLQEFKKFNLFASDSLNSNIYEGLGGKPRPYTRIIYELNKEKYAYDEKSDEWYMYENHRWNVSSGLGSGLREKFDSDLKNVYEKIKEHYVEQDGENSKTVKLVSQIIINIGGTQLADDVTKELKHIYAHKNNKYGNIIEKLNKNQYLIGFTSAIYNLETHTFREGRIDDYISMSTGYNYKSKYSVYHEKLLKFLEDIQPDKNERDYLLTYISTALFGNTLELFTILFGDGSNGKNKFVELLDKAFGDYYDTMKMQMLASQIKDSYTPAPALLNLANKKIVVVSEMLAKTKPNSGFMKTITSRDTEEHRLCHKNEMIKFAPKFITLLVCNNIPECDNIDNAISKRLRCINFPTEFVDGKPEKPNQKEKDVTINRFFDNWKQDFFLLLLDYYKKYEKNKDLIKPTEKILKWANQYKKHTDVYLEFLNECTECTKESDMIRIKSIDLYKVFKIWCEKNNLGRYIPCGITFSMGIKNHKRIESIKFPDGQVTSGIKNLKINNEYMNYIINNHENNNNNNQQHNKITIFKNKKTQKIIKEIPKNIQVMNLNNSLKIKCKSMGDEIPCDGRGQLKYDNYCDYCFYHLFPNDPRVKLITRKTKEYVVKHHVFSNHKEEWYHDRPMHFNYGKDCCINQRRIDLRTLIGNTLLCIEIDEDQHKNYAKSDEFIRYNELLFCFTCKYIFIRYNPDKYMHNGILVDTDTNTRLEQLSHEINKQINRINNNENEDSLEIVHLYYDD